MTPDEMRSRTKTYANRIVRCVQALPNTIVGRSLGRQLLDCGTSVGANYRAVCRAKSKPDFINKLKIVEEECDESIFWMELLIDNGLMSVKQLEPLMEEGNEILAIVVASAKRARSAPDSSIVNRKS